MSLLFVYIVWVYPFMFMFVHSNRFNILLRYPDEPSFIMPEVLKAKVKAGELGRKSGKGLYHWKGDRRGDPVE